MYHIKKKIEVSASHQLQLDYDSASQKIHGHNWCITVYCKSEKLNSGGMIVDFSTIQKTITGMFDNQHMNDKVTFNPTAENIARYVCEVIPYCYKVEVKETEGNEAMYEVTGV